METYFTSDMEEGAVFLSLDERLIGTKVDTNGYILFEFENSPTIEKAHRDYLAGKLVLPINTLFANLRKTRSLYLRANRGSPNLFIHGHHTGQSTAAHALAGTTRGGYHRKSTGNTWRRDY